MTQGRNSSPRRVVASGFPTNRAEDLS